MSSNNGLTDWDRSVATLLSIAPMILPEDVGNNLGTIENTVETLLAGDTSRVRMQGFVRGSGQVYDVGLLIQTPDGLYRMQEMQRTHEFTDYSPDEAREQALVLASRPALYVSQELQRQGVPAQNIVINNEPAIEIDFAALEASRESGFKVAHRE